MRETYMIAHDDASSESDCVLVLLWDETSICGLVFCYDEAQLITVVHP